MEKPLLHGDRYEKTRPLFESWSSQPQVRGERNRKPFIGHGYLPTIMDHADDLLKSVVMEKDIPLSSDLFPFGEEDDYCKRSLIIAVHNYVNTGEWELARTCLFSLLSSGFLTEMEKDELSNFLVEVIRVPHFYCTGHRSLPSPAHLSWLAFLAHQEFFKEHEAKLPPWVKPLIEFRLLLHELLPDGDKQTQEVFDTFHISLFTMSESDPVSSCELSSAMLSTLRQLLEQNPLRCKALTDFITSSVPYDPIKRQIRELYIEFVQQWLAKVSEDEVKFEGNAWHPIFLLNLLIFGDDYLDTEAEEDYSIIKEISNAYLQRCSSHGLGIKDALSATVSKQTGTIHRYIRHLYRESILEEVNLKGRLSESGRHTVLDSKWDDSRTCLSSVISDALAKNSVESWKYIFWISEVYQIHFLETLINSTLRHIRDGNLRDAALLMAPDICRPLGALIILVSWPEFSSYVDAEQLLNTLWVEKGGCPEPLLDQACQKLEYQLKIMTWCLEKARSVLGSSAEMAHQTVLKMFHRFDSHSVLYVLNKAHLLQSLGHSEVVNLLHDQPIAAKLDEQESLSVDVAKVQSEVATYNAYYVTKEFLQVLLVQRAREVNKTSLNSVNSSCPYMNTAAALNELKTVIDKINPHKFRLELLENLFSLLFLQGTDLFELPEHDLDDENLEGLTHSVLSSRSCSLESFSTVDTLDPQGKEDTLIRNDVAGGLSEPPDSVMTNPLDPLKSFDNESCEILESEVFPGPPHTTEEHLQDSSCQGDYSSSETLKNEQREGNVAASMEELARMTVPGVEYGIRDIGKGFMVGENVMLVALEFLQECLSRLGEGKPETAESQVVDNTKLCSIDDEYFEERLSLLNQYVNEGLWRLHLISGSEDSDNEDVEDSMSAVFDSDTNLQSPIMSPRDDRGKFGRYPQNGLGLAGSGIVPKMLYPQDSLVYLCLNKKNPVQAQQVIKMFGLEDTNCAHETSFIQELQEMVSEFQAVIVNKSSEVPPTSTSSALSSIRSAAAAGRKSTMVMSRLDQFLLHPFVKNLQEISIEEDEQEFWRASYLNHCALLSDLVLAENFNHSVVKTITDLCDLKLNEATEWFQLSRIETASPIFSFLTNYRGLLTLSHQLTDTPLLKNINQVFLIPSCSSTPEEVKPFLEAQELYRKSYQTLQEIILNTHDGMELEKEASVEGSATRQAMANLVSGLALEHACMAMRMQHGHDYVKCLFKHIDTLATLQLVYKTRHTENQEKSRRPVSLGLTKAVNPFVVLRSEMTVTFGRLLFEWKMSPKRLESVAKQVNINLFNVIAKRCGIFIPSRPQKHQSDDIVDCLTVLPEMVLNDLEEEIVPHDVCGHPCDIVRELLHRCISIVKGIGSEGDSFIGSKKFTLVIGSDEFKDFQRSTCRLVYVDLAQLGDEKTKLCFMANLFNLLMLHGTLILMGGQIFKTCNEEKLLAKRWTFEAAMCRQLGRLNVHRIFTYQVGDLGKLSALDLFMHVILGGKVSSFFGEGLSQPVTNFAWSEKFLKYAPERCHPYMVFLIHHCTAGGPELKVIETSDVANEEAAARAFLSGKVFVDANNAKVQVPELIKLHRHLFLPREPLSSLHGESTLDNTEFSWTLLNFLRPLCSEIDANFPKIDKASVSVVFSDYDWRLRLPKSRGELCTYSNCGLLSGTRKEDITLLSEPISQYLHEVFPLAGTVISLSVNRRKLLCELADLAPEESPVPSSSDVDTSLIVHTVKQGVLLLRDSSSKYKILENAVEEACTPVLRLERHVKHLNVNNKDGARLVSRLFQTRLLSVELGACEEGNDLPFVSCIMDIFTHIGHADVLLDIIDSDIKLLPVKTRDFFLCEVIREVVLKIQVHLNGPKSILSMLYNKLAASFLLIADISCLHRVVLENIELFPAHRVLTLLPLVVERCEGSPNLVSDLEKKLSEVLWCYQVSSYLRSEVLEHKVDGLKENSCGWQDTRYFIRTQPENVAKCLVQHGRFDLLGSWSEHFGMSGALEQECHQAKLISVLQEAPLDIIKAHRVLEQTGSREVALSVCQALLSKTMLSFHQTFFLTDYVLNNLCDLLSGDKKRDFILLKLGTMSLQYVPKRLRKSYHSLVSRPLLLLEQLLMNMKVEVAVKVVTTIRKEASAFSHLGELNAECDDLFARYAGKALDVPSTNNGVITDSVSKTPGMEHSQRKSERKHMRQLSASSKPVLKEGKPGEQIADNGAIGKGDHTGNREKQSNMLPLKPLNRSEWVKDDAVLLCMLCEIGRFSMFNRRHHCRHCGRVVCSDCSKHFCGVPGHYGNVRVCDQCHNQFYSAREKNSDAKGKGSGDVSGQKSTDGVTGLTSMVSQGVIEAEVTTQELESFSEWSLTLDDDANEDTRAEFSYDQAPSASLCISILDLYSNHRACGGLLLKFCNDLSANVQTKERHSGRLYEEVDANMIVGMIRYLTLHAKVKFLKSGDLKGVELCDTYLVYVEVLEVLLANSWKTIPTMQELSQPEALRRLRDKLVEDERFSIAIEITSKCGLDANVVWFALGMAQLRTGVFEQARENFTKCMTSTKAEITKIFPQNIPYLEQIVDVLETSSPFSPTNLFSLEATFNQVEMGRQAIGTGLSKRRYDECIYYLTNYGSSGLTVDFYVRHNDLRKACLFIKNRNCDADVFVEHLLLPCLQEGSFLSLGREMTDIDSSLTSWSLLLNSACLILSRRGYYNCLYEVQLLMKDYFRAAKTCVRFYLGTSGSPPESYLNLYERLGYLDKAQNHIESVLKDRLLTRSNFVSHVGPSFLGDSQQAMAGQQHEVSNGELKSYLNAIELQVLVTKYFYEHPKSNEWEKGKLPTLFGHGRERAEVVVKLLQSSVEDSFSLASRIVQDFRLPVLGVYGRAAKKMAQQQNYEAALALLKIVEDTGIVVDKEKDDLLLSIVKLIAQQEGQMKQTNGFIRLIKNDIVKTDALISCNRLRDALQKAIRKERVSQIHIILLRAKETEQAHVVDLCQRWLESYKEREEMQQAVLRKSRLVGKGEDRPSSRNSPSPKLKRGAKKK